MAGRAPAAKRWTRAGVASAAVLVALAAVLLVRAAYGIEWYGDEAYAFGTAGRYAAGDRPIVEGWESHFSSGMVLAPFAWAAHRAFPSGEGVVLGWRYLFVLAQALYAFAVWRLVKRATSPPVALAVAAATLFYLPYFYVFPYYNSLMVPAFTLAALLAWRGIGDEEQEPRPRFLLAAGAAAAFGVIVYPTMLVALPFFCAGIAMALRGRPGPATREALLRFLAGVAVPLVAFAALTLVLAGGGAKLAQALPLFAQPVDRAITLGALVSRLARTWSVLIPSAAAVAAFAAAAVAWPPRRRGPLPAALAALLAALLAGFVTYRLRLPFISYLDMPQATALGAGLVVPLLMLWTPTPRVRSLFWLLCVPALGVGLGTMPASHEGFETAAMPAIVAVVAACIALAPADPALSRRARTLAAAGSVTVAAFFAATVLLYAGGDGAVRQLDTRVTRGPYAGIRTTAAGAARYDGYLRVLAPVSAGRGRVAFVEEFPQGYVLTGRLPGTYSVWDTLATGDRWQKYLDITGDYPQQIVATRFEGPNGGVADRPFAPPFGLRDFASTYRETYRDADFVIYDRIPR